MNRQRAFWLLVLVLLGGRDAGAQLSVLALGDSNTEGWIAGRRQPELAYPALLSESLGSSFSVQNSGLGGANTRHGLRVFQEQAYAMRPEVVIIAYGINDLRLTDSLRPFVDTGEFAGNLLAMVEAGHSLGAEIILVAPVPLDSLTFAAYPGAEAYAPFGGLGAHENRYVQVLQRVADEAGAHYLDTAAVLEDEMQGGVGPDGIHLAAEGHARLAGALAEVIVQLAGPPYPDPPSSGFALAAAGNPLSVREGREALVRFDLERDARVDFRVYGIDGRVVFSGETAGWRPAGSHFWTWDLNDDGGRRVASGIYLVRLTVWRSAGDSRQESIKITLSR